MSFHLGCAALTLQLRHITLSRRRPEQTAASALFSWQMDYCADEIIFTDIMNLLFILFETSKLLLLLFQLCFDSGLLRSQTSYSAYHPHGSDMCIWSLFMKWLSYLCSALNGWLLSSEHGACLYCSSLGISSILLPCYLSEPPIQGNSSSKRKDHSKALMVI